MDYYSYEPSPNEKTPWWIVFAVVIIMLAYIACTGVVS